MPVIETVIAGKKVLDVALPVGKKCIEVAMPVIKQGSLICFKFIQGGIAATQGEKIKLSKPLDIVDHDLSIPASFSDNQLIPFKNKVANDLFVIKGQNEMIFLSNSISYFIDSHKNRTGLDRSISYALQYDINAVREHLKSNREIRFPGYLLHQCVSLAETIKELNILYVSILDGGKVPAYPKKSVREELTRRFGAKQDKPKLTSYIPYDLQLPVLKELADNNKKNKTLVGGVIDKVTGKKEEIDIDEIEDKAHEALFVLCEELIANEELECKIEEKLKNISDKRLVIECSTEDDFQ